MTPTHAWFCGSCGRLLYRAFVPKDRDPKDYKPVECGHCSSVNITVRAA
jgi:DNA-directed RNA polymerase subunit RPC12/RpoP